MIPLLKITVQFLVIGLFFLFAGCSQTPARIDVYKELSEGTPYHVSVEKGDTLYSISKKYDVNLREIIDANRISPPYTLYTGQMIKLPKPRFHLVKDKDTLYSISRAYNVDMNTLTMANNIEEPFLIYTGQKLRIPSATEINENKERSFAQNNEKVDYNTKSSSFNRDVESNDLSPLSENTVSESKQVEISIPVPTKEEVPDNQPVLTSNLNSSGIPIPTLKPSTAKALEQEVSTTNVATTTKEPESTASTEKVYVKTTKASLPVEIPSLGKPSFSWPVRGKVISSYGAKEGGLYNDGINISASEGTKIQAAESGVVVYSGNELRGYGNLLLIKHGEGYLTAYAHTKENAVQKGDVVKKGDVIGYVGKTGHVTLPQLHFSIRQGRKAVDPKKYLPG